MVLFIFVSPAKAQSLQIQTGDPVPRDVRDLYDRGLQYLSANQDDEGCWPSGRGARGLPVWDWCVSSPPVGIRIWALRINVRRAIRFILLPDLKPVITGKVLSHRTRCLLSQKRTGWLMIERLEVRRWISRSVSHWNWRYGCDVAER